MKDMSRRGFLTVAGAAAAGAALAGCSGGAQSDAGASDAGPETFTEGADTSCEAEFSAYAGEHASMFLEQGDTVAVISPSALPTREQVDAVVAGLKGWGYVPVEGEHVIADVRTLDDCLADLEWAPEDDA